MLKKRSLSPDEALQKAKNICSRQEKCISDINKKLMQWHVNKKDAENIIKSLVKENFINEKRFASLFAKSKLHQNKWGKIKIAYALRHKNIGSNDISSAMAEIDQNEYVEMIEQEIAKKCKWIDANSEHELNAKLLRFAAQRGFEPDLAERIIQSIT